MDVWYTILTRMLLRTQKCIIHGCMLSAQWSMTMFVLNFGGQLVHLDMATWVWTSSRGRPGFDPGHPNGILWLQPIKKNYFSWFFRFNLVDLVQVFWNKPQRFQFEFCFTHNFRHILMSVLWVSLLYLLAFSTEALLFQLLYAADEEEFLLNSLTKIFKMKFISCAPSNDSR